MERRKPFPSILVVRDALITPVLGGGGREIMWEVHQKDLLCLRNWKQGQPDNYGEEPGEDCVEVVGYSFGQWSDENCNTKRKYICKHINRESANSACARFTQAV